MAQGTCCHRDDRQSLGYAYTSMSGSKQVQKNEGTRSIAHILLAGAKQKAAVQVCQHSYFQHNMTL
jgi:hypothetical protein